MSSPSSTTPGPDPRSRGEADGRSWVRLIGARALTILAILLALVGMVAFYVEHTALDEQGFETISRKMIENDEIRTQVAAKSVDTLFANVDVEAAIAEQLPPSQQKLAPVLAGLARSGADRAADALLERPRVQTLWVQVTTRAQRQLVQLLDDKDTFIQTQGGAVVLDLHPLVIQLGDQVAVIGKVAERLPESSGRVVILQESQLETAQTMTKILRAVADWMWLVALAVAALAVWVARGRRRLELRAIALGLVVVGLLLLAVRRFAGDYLVDHLVKDDGVKPAGRAAWSILTQVLADRAWVWIIFGVLMLLGVWFVGESGLAAKARRAAAPTLESRPTTYGIVAVGLLVLVLVAPQLARGWLSALLLIGLVIAGVEVVRGIVIRDPAPGSGSPV
jgi:hypothetical protein